jgi:hypothetical protein
MSSIAYQKTLPVSWQHDKIHKGELYTVSLFADAVADNATSIITIVAPSGYNLHVTPSFHSGAAAQAEIYSGPTISVAGSAFTPVNRNQASSNVSSVTTHTGATVTSDGTLVEEYALSYSNEFGGRDREIVLAAGTTYMFRLTNRSGSAQPQSISLDFYKVAT